MEQWRSVAGMVLAAGLLLTALPRGSGGQANPLDIVLDLDISGSMKKNDPQGLMMETVGLFIRELGSEDAAGLVLFGGRATVAQPLAALSGPGQRDALLAGIAQIKYADPRTNIAAAIERGLYELKSKARPGSARALIFATDGIMDTGSAARDDEMKRWLRQSLLPEARKQGVRIFGIAFTEQADFTLIQEMARETGGEYFRALKAEEIRGIFQQISAVLRKPPEIIKPPDTISEKTDVRPSAPAPESRSPFWIGGGAAILLAIAAIIVFGWRAARGRPLRAAKGNEPAARAPAAHEAPMPAAELMDLGTRNIISVSKPVVRIGRDLDNDVLINAATVSAHHAQIEYRRGKFYLTDLRSTNGTFVDQKKVEGEVLLKSGDILRFDEFRYTFLGPEPMPGGTMVREGLSAGGAGDEKRRKTLTLDRDSIKK